MRDSLITDLNVNPLSNTGDFPEAGYSDKDDIFEDSNVPATGNKPFESKTDLDSDSPANNHPGPRDVDDDEEDFEEDEIIEQSDTGEDDESLPEDELNLTDDFEDQEPYNDDDETDDEEDY